MRSFCFEIIYGILLIVQKGHSTPDGQRVALNVRPLQPKRFFLAKPAVQTEGAEYAGAWFYDYTHQNIDLIGKQSLFLFRFSVRGDFDTLSRIINNQMIQTCFLKKLAHVFGRFLREPSASVTCRCGGEVQLDNLTRYEFTCPCCDFEARGRTNLEDPEITVPCKCGNPVTMKWDRNKRMYHE